jgi:hypothetical protein
LSAQAAIPAAQTGGDFMAMTTMSSRSGTKLYTVRGKDGKFKDIQTYKRAHSADMKRKSAAEKKAAGAKKKSAAKRRKSASKKKRR